MKNQMKYEDRPRKYKQFKGKKGIATNFAEELEQETKKWYQEIPEDPAYFATVTDEKLIQLKDEAKRCNDAEVATYNIKNSKTNSEYQWMKTVMSKGTVSDKIAAFTLLIQDDPVCNLATIHNMINMVKVGKKKECVTAMDTLAELFLSDLLKPNTKLKPFYQRPLSKLDDLTSGNATARRKYLSIWYFEDQLKECYTSFVQALNTAAQDTVEANKEKAIAAMYKLLIGNPEQEKNLLSNIVNKLGDPSQKVASKAIYCLGQVLYEHPVMKQVVLNEIERLLFRPNVSVKAQYYGVCFLSQFILSHEDFDVAKNLIGVYFAFFKACIKKDEIDSRMMSALLMGVNRAYPYAQSELDKISEHIDTMYKVVHVATFNVAIHALNLLYQISDYSNSVKDRFYTALYKKLLDTQIGATKHQALFLNLIFRALNNDTNVSRIRTFIKRLLQLALYMQPAMSCAILFLIQNLIKEKKNLLALKSNDGAVFKNDDEPNKKQYRQRKTSESDIKPDISTLNEPIKPTSSWDHSAITIKSEYNHPDITEFNPMVRNPQYAGGQFCVYLELLDLQKHFHPTVSLYATKILNAEPINYSGDPLKDFTLHKFLERFSFRNPKKPEDVEKKGVNPVFAKRELKTATGVKAHAVNSKNYLNYAQKNIPVEELFMYTYLLKKQQLSVRSKVKDQDDDESDVESVGDDEFDEMLDKMSGSKKLDQDELDFMNDIGDALKAQKKGKNEDDESSDDDEDDQDQGEEMDFSGDDDVDDDDLQGLDTNMGGFEDHGDDDDDDLEDEDDDLDFEDDDNDFIEEEPSKNKNKKSKKNITSVFASADEFAELLDEEPDFMAGSSQAMSNKDNANKKQINWEANRNRWIKGYDKAVGGKKQQFGKKRQKPQKTGNNNHKNKKQKK